MSVKMPKLEEIEKSFESLNKMRELEQRVEIIKLIFSLFINSEATKCQK